MTEQWQLTLEKILLAQTKSLKELALIAGADPKRFYRSADFSGIDLGKLDLRGVVLPDDVRLNYKSEASSGGRIVLHLSPLVHTILKRGNPGSLSAHVSVLVRVFLDLYFSEWRKTRQTSRRIQAQLVHKIMSSFEIDGLHDPAAPFYLERIPVSYHLDQELRERVADASKMIGRSKAEFVRVAIYFVLLNDSLRSLLNYNEFHVIEGVLFSLPKWMHEAGREELRIRRKNSSPDESWRVRVSLSGIRRQYSEAIDGIL